MDMMKDIGKVFLTRTEKKSEKLLQVTMHWTDRLAIAASVASAGSLSPII
jgi:hypothetical protein